MKISKIVLSLALLLSFSLILGASQSMAQEEMTMDEYEAQLQEWQEREAKAKADLAECQQTAEDIKAEMDQVEADIAQVWQDIYAEIGTDEAAIDEFRQNLKALDAEVSGLLALSPEELFTKREEVKAAEEQLETYKKNRISALTEMQNMIASIEGKLTQVRNKMPKAVYDEYNVVVGDYLWKISGKEEIYDNPMQWMRIYSYNSDQIKDPDLIYPDQILKIQREVGPEEYLVEKGDYLAKIAGKADILGDPASWTKIYEKNKGIIGEDANMIFPYTVLVVPAN
jgi:nucleoid-associated protein YgaU